ncbi:hypothetical protein SPF06_18885 [Sinomonas sp. JGH33]|uniref:Uncharacterized protein n=1 Tax=Sinomonas terricola TaxID=3110330 RepID=A0ABU5TBD1_9MICC|nr:hypothetical protein [Sinomonas sp. JGH33]MEA5456794.1 hypothetical protein [Sinomonas sp. JGH33]
MTASHVRADDQLREEPVILTRASKPRRGRHAAEMDLAMAPGTVRADGPDDFASASGVYRIALELCGRARRLIGSDALLVFLGVNPVDRTRGGSKLRPLPTHALEWWRGTSPNGTVLPRVDSRRLRVAFVQRHQRPVAHTAATLVSEYLAKDVTALPEYQAVVSDVLHSEVERVCVGHSVLTLTDEEVRAAADDPGPVAQRLGTTVERLKLMLEGRLDTVAAACMDHTNSPYGRAGTPCTASFLLCLGCPNARSEPRHIPTQAVMLQSITRRRTEFSPSEWEARYATAHEQLTDLLDRQHADPEAAAKKATDEDGRLVELLLDRGLDLR